IGRHAATVIARLGRDPELAFRWHMIRGNVLATLAKRVQASEEFEKALRLRESTNGPEDPGVGSALFGLGRMAQKLGKAEVARGYFRRAMPIYEKRPGPEHPVTALV